MQLTKGTSLILNNNSYGREWRPSDGDGEQGDWMVFRYMAPHVPTGTSVQHEVVGFNSTDVISSLEGSPLLCRTFEAMMIPITNFIGAPMVIHKHVHAWGCPVTSLEGGPLYVEGSYEVDGDTLKNLHGAPIYVGGDFCVYGNKLDSLTGMPKYIGCNLFLPDTIGGEETNWRHVREWLDRNNVVCRGNIELANTF